MLENKVQMRKGEVKAIIRAIVSIDNKSIDNVSITKLAMNSIFYNVFCLIALTKKLNCHFL